ncbi:MAG: hypothetical protein EXR53_04610 [Dehalococcoidia bacterium]|nr:hypothetical protein [Dehalococcoidia bacterium]
MAHEGTPPQIATGENALAMTIASHALIMSKARRPMGMVAIPSRRSAAQASLRQRHHDGRK